jgi:hypothetical protein
MAKKPASTKSKSTSRSTSSAKKASPKSRKSTSRSTSSPAKSGKSVDDKVTIDRRRQADRRSEEATSKPAVKLERRKKVQRRRQIDPTTCERDYSVQEVEFMNAMEQYKRKSGRMFPTCSEVLEVIRGLGYTQFFPSELAVQRGQEQQAVEATAEQGTEESEVSEQFLSRQNTI